MRHLTGRKAFQSQAMFLLKAQGAFHTEAGIEPLIAKRLEFDPAVVRMRSQPLRVDLVIDGKPVSYTPDMAVLFDNGDRAIWEVKPDWHHLQDDHYMRKLTLAAFTFLERGWHFRTLVRAQFDETSSETNRIINDSISLMFPSRLTVITESQKAAVARLLIAGSSTLGAVCAVIGGTVAAARARAYAMMARRLINIDLTRPLTDSSPVHAVAALPDYLPPLRF
ncbi:TnsA endonuclease N-terminal domain-containing protein [Sphingomonas sp. PR090111-T3T-6A]|uniref:TnsA endonuclease N-terminal domain-containing protein n=1 Tax=Sphingomonas sp. PR090111-T3T-6A TaxID=685778 RepID=UPI0003A77730|nr:TnsA endonuclease N-terminal domain-containing protein [Sphingomonas sp. PR090111-T3T-6A]